MPILFPPYPRPLAQASLRAVTYLFADVDGTLTTDGKLSSGVLQSLEKLTGSGIYVVLVTGRPAGFGECWLRTLPVEGVVAENGGLYFAWTQGRRLKKVYARAEPKRSRERRRLSAEVRRVMNSVPKVKLSTDSQYTEVDLALDYNEEVRLGRKTAELLENRLSARGVKAVRSSIHVNCWLGPFDKRWMVERYMRNEWRMRLGDGPDQCLYVGDSLNDAPMFDAFPLSVGVANVLDVFNELEAAPKYVTRAREGAGFVELASAVLTARGVRP